MVTVEHIMCILFVALFLGYTGTIVIKYGVQRSISYTFYVINNPIHFILFCWYLAIIYLLISPTLLSFIAASGIVLVGGHPFIKEKHCFIIHMISAVIGIAFSQLSIVFDYQNYILFAISVLSFILIAIFLRKKNVFWWLEIAAFTSITINNFITIY